MHVPRMSKQYNGFRHAISASIQGISHDSEKGRIVTTIRETYTWTSETHICHNG
jgi:hypothetical protein